jgi:hypothetical protein
MAHNNECKRPLNIFACCDSATFLEAGVQVGLVFLFILFLCLERQPEAISASRLEKWVKDAFVHTVGWNHQFIHIDLSMLSASQCLA